MTALQTYDDILAEVQDWLFGRADLLTKVPTFIRLAEAKGNRMLECRQMETRATTPILIDSDEPQYVALPTDFQEMRRLCLADQPGKPKLSFMTLAQMADRREERRDEAGIPEYFTVTGTELELFPTPVVANMLEMVYRCSIPPLTAENPQNWLLQLAPDFYLYGALLEAAPYLHEDDRIPVWKGGMDAAISQLNGLTQRALYNAGPLKIRRRRGY